MPNFLYSQLEKGNGPTTQNAASLSPLSFSGPLMGPTDVNVTYLPEGLSLDCLQSVLQYQCEIQ